MSSPSNRFECRWQASRLLLAAYLLAQLFALGALLLGDLPFYGLGILLCLAHAVWVLPRHILLNHRSSIRGLRRDEDGWQLLCDERGWHPVQLRPDSLALPLIVVLRYRVQGRMAGAFDLCAEGRAGCRCASAPAGSLEVQPP